MTEINNAIEFLKAAGLTKEELKKLKSLIEEMEGDNEELYY